MVAISAVEQSSSTSTTSTSNEWSDRPLSDVICLFDVDGTLSPSRKTASEEMISLLKELKKKCVIGYVGGSDLAKQKEQLGEDAATSLFDFGFSENGATAFKNGQQIGNESFIGFLGEEKYKKLINFILHYIADLDIPVKRGCFVEFRNAMINVSPIGRNCSYQERLDFEAFDKKHAVRANLVKALQEAFPDYGLKYSIGGQISIDVFPIGWDKTFCLRHLKAYNFREIHFFGDKTAEGGNDFEIFNHPSVLGHTVVDPSDTIRQLQALFFQ